MNLPDEIQSQKQLRGRFVPRRENLVSKVFIEALCLLGQGTDQIECQARLIVLIVLEFQHICRNAR